MKSANCLILILAPLTFSFFACKKSATSVNARSNIYVSGYIDTLGQSTGAYWTNDSLKIISGPGQLNGVAFANNNLYLLEGTGYWVNGTYEALPNVLNTNTFNMVVNGLDVYIAGAGLLGSPEAIGVVNGTVYVTGQSFTHGYAYWVNGNEIALNSSGLVSAMAISGNDVYIAGFTNNGPDQAVYWKNGQLVTLPNGSSATGIAVSGNDVYVCGNGGSNDAVYWKNGVIHILGTGGATGIVVGN
jgi:hypothetical protein